MRNFKKAIQNTIIFLLIIIILTLPFPIFYLEYSMDNWTATTDIVERNACAGEITTLFLGASHGLKAFIPEIYDNKMNCQSYNLCGTLCTWKGRYALLKEEIERNPIDTVYLEVSFNSLSRNSKTESPEGDLDVIRRLGNRKSKWEYALNSLSLDDWSVAYYLYTHNGFSAVVEMYSVDRNSKYEESLAKKGYLEGETNNLQLSPEEYALQSKTESVSETVYQENLEYLNRIFQLCNDRNIEVIMITAPLSDAMINRVDNLDNVKNIYMEIARENGCDFYDFNLWKDKKTSITDKTGFQDDLHLSALGAENFTTAFAQLMYERKNGIDISKYFYTSYAEY